MNSSLIAVLVVAGLACSFLNAQTAPSSAPSVIAASDKDALTAAKGQEVTVEGRIESAKWSASGKVMSIRFAGSEVQAVVFQSSKDKLDAQFSGDLGKALTGAKVRIKGKLEDFRDKPEIRIAQGSQITIEEAAPTTNPAKS